MNLAYRDIKHNTARFVLTCVGLSMLLGIVITMQAIDGPPAEIGQLLEARRADIDRAERQSRE